MNSYPPHCQHRQQVDATQWHHIHSAQPTHARASSIAEAAPARFDWSSTNAHYTPNHATANMRLLSGFSGGLQQQQNYQRGRLQQPRHLPLSSQRQHIAIDQEKPPSPFFIDRGNGQYTRLIPADILPDLVEVPKREGPEVEGTRLPGHECGNRMLTLKQSGRDAVQSRIDTLTSATNRPPKREKIYCDKWVHEGICSFAQQGCRYLHIMPEDRATQQLLGLYQGYPPWWRKKLEQDALAAGAQLDRADGMLSSATMRGTGDGPISSPSLRRHDGNRSHARLGHMADSQGWVDDMTRPQGHVDGRNPGYTWIAESPGAVTPDGSPSSFDTDGGSFTSPTKSSLMNRGSLGAGSYGPIQRPPWAEKN